MEDFGDFNKTLRYKNMERNTLKIHYRSKFKLERSNARVHRVQEALLLSSHFYENLAHEMHSHQSLPSVNR